jgi:hypothetical protein
MGKKTQKDYMQDGTFAELMEAAEQALAYERGVREGYRVMQVDGLRSPRRVPIREAVFPKNNPGSRRKHKKSSQQLINPQSTAFIILSTAAKSNFPYPH